MIKKAALPTVSFSTLGCRLNQSETAVIQNTLKKNGYRIVNFGEPAEIAVINTCTVTENGDADTRRLVNKVSRLNPSVRIALIGCQAQIQKEKLSSLPNVRWIVGNAKKMDLLKIFSEETPDPHVRVIAPAISRESFTHAAAAIDKRLTRANLKIQDGCDFFCSFCEIPYARGRARSRIFSDILKEAGILVESGYKEIVLTGINIGTYLYENKTLIDVITAMEKLSGLERIRISSIEPTTIDWGIIQKMSSSKKLCRYLHIPLQSGSNEILRLMKRKYTIEYFREFITRTSRMVPGICIGTDIIVGFPGETDAHFQETYQQIENLPVNYAHVFSYSQRHMAKSREYSGIASEKIISQRSLSLRDVSQLKRKAFYRSLIGSTQTVLFEQKSENGWTGLSDNYARIKTESSIPLNNRLLKVKINSLDGKELSAELLGTND